MKKRVLILVMSIFLCLLLIGVCFIDAKSYDEKEVPLKKPQEIKQKSKSIGQEKQTEEVKDDEKKEVRLSYESKGKNDTHSQISEGKTKEAKEEQQEKIGTTHIHSFKPVTEENVIYDYMEIYGSKCNCCGYTTSSAAAMYSHIDSDPFDNCGSYSTGVIIGTSKKERIETSIKGYECSCGAKK